MALTNSTLMIYIEFCLEAGPSLKGLYFRHLLSLGACHSSMIHRALRLHGAR